MSAPATSSQPDYRHQTYDLKTPEDHRRVYDEWAKKYDEDVMSESTLYVGPRLTVEAVQKANGKIDGAILDAGCGTGLCGVALAGAGAKIIDGIDVSPGMLKVAETTKAYRNLVPADMQQKLTLESDQYDVVTCVGTFTTGHVKPVPAFAELIRVMKKGGVFAATVLDTIYKPEGFEAEIQRLQAAGDVDVLSLDRTEYRRGDNAYSIMVVLRKK